MDYSFFAFNEDENPHIFQQLSEGIAPLPGVVAASARHDRRQREERSRSVAQAATRATLPNTAPSVLPLAGYTYATRAHVGMRGMFGTERHMLEKVGAGIFADRFPLSTIPGREHVTSSSTATAPPPSSGRNAVFLSPYSDDAAHMRPWSLVARTPYTPAADPPVRAYEKHLHEINVGLLAVEEERRKQLKQQAATQALAARRTLSADQRKEEDRLAQSVAAQALSSVQMPDEDAYYYRPKWNLARSFKNIPLTRTQRMDALVQKNKRSAKPLRAKHLSHNLPLPGEFQGHDYAALQRVDVAERDKVEDRTFGQAWVPGTGRQKMRALCAGPAQALFNSFAFLRDQEGLRYAGKLRRNNDSGQGKETSIEEVAMAILPASMEIKRQQLQQQMASPRPGSVLDKRLSMQQEGPRALSADAEASSSSTSSSTHLDRVPLSIPASVASMPVHNPYFASSAAGRVIGSRLMPNAAVQAFAAQTTEASQKEAQTYEAHIDDKELKQQRQALERSKRHFTRNADAVTPWLACNPMDPHHVTLHKVTEVNRSRMLRKRDACLSNAHKQEEAKKAKEKRLLRKRAAEKKKQVAYGNEADADEDEDGQSTDDQGGNGDDEEDEGQEANEEEDGAVAGGNTAASDYLTTDFDEESFTGALGPSGGVRKFWLYDSAHRLVPPDLDPLRMGRLYIGQGAPGATGPTLAHGQGQGPGPGPHDQPRHAGNDRSGIFWPLESPPPNTTLHANGLHIGAVQVLRERQRRDQIVKTALGQAGRRATDPHLGGGQGGGEGVGEGEGAAVEKRMSLGAGTGAGVLRKEESPVSTGEAFGLKVSQGLGLDLSMHFVRTVNPKDKRMLSKELIPIVKVATVSAVKSPFGPKTALHTPTHTHAVTATVWPPRSVDVVELAEDFEFSLVPSKDFALTTEELRRLKVREQRQEERREAEQKAATAREEKLRVRRQQMEGAISVEMNKLEIAIEKKRVAERANRLEKEKLRSESACMVNQTVQVRLESYLEKEVLRVEHGMSVAVKKLRYLQARKRVTEVVRADVLQQMKEGRSLDQVVLLDMPGPSKEEDASILKAVDARLLARFGGTGPAGHAREGDGGDATDTEVPADTNAEAEANRNSAVYYDNFLSRMRLGLVDTGVDPFKERYSKATDSTYVAPPFVADRVSSSSSTSSSSSSSISSSSSSGPRGSPAATDAALSTPNEVPAAHEQRVLAAVDQYLLLRARRQHLQTLLDKHRERRKNEGAKSDGDGAILRVELPSPTLSPPAPSPLRVANYAGHSSRPTTGFSESSVYSEDEPFPPPPQRKPPPRPVHTNASPATEAGKASGQASSSASAAAATSS